MCSSNAKTKVSGKKKKKKKKKNDPELKILKNTHELINLLNTEA